ncbi:hypothetical protein [Inquilinus sp. Marseille-Q2685]|uniref:hypothetical protein n=1 Tax=Inquilinus sp. Marseille-Q2685 TaxID=2866581 RepID=UPI001CE3DADE|nr:hypothetical protein [Inquilinus sp. Marseille-Q2685]
MRRAFLLVLLPAAAAFAPPTISPALAQAPAYHVQLQVNTTTDLGRGSCQVSTGVIGTYPDSAGRLAIGTPVNLLIPCAAARASYFDARLAGRPGALQPAGPDALRPLATPMALPAAPVAPRLASPPPQLQPQPLQPPRQVLIAPTTPAPTPRAASPFTAPRPAPQPMLPLPANPVAPSRPLVIQGGPPVVTGTVPPSTAFTPPPSPTFASPLPPPVRTAQGGDTATMRPDAAIVLSFGPVSAARTGTSQRVVLPTDPSYPALLTQLGGIVPGQTKPLP